MTHLKLNNRPVVKEFDNFFNDFFQFPAVWSNNAQTSGVPAANISETPEAFQLELNVPGRNKEDFKIHLDKGLLTISYEKKQENTQEGLNAIRREFTFNSFKRSFTIDDKIDVNNIQARYDNGILKVELPKRPELKQEPKQIAIN